MQMMSCRNTSYLMENLIIAPIQLELAWGSNEARSDKSRTSPQDELVFCYLSYFSGIVKVKSL